MQRELLKLIMAMRMRMRREKTRSVFRHSGKSITSVIRGSTPNVTNPAKARLKKDVYIKNDKIKRRGKDVDDLMGGKCRRRLASIVFKRALTKILRTVILKKVTRITSSTLFKVMTAQPLLEPKCPRSVVATMQIIEVIR